jgi:hypothetical protein
MVSLRQHHNMEATHPILLLMVKLEKLAQFLATQL